MTHTVATSSVFSNRGAQDMADAIRTENKSVSPHGRNTTASLHETTLGHGQLSLAPTLSTKKQNVVMASNTTTPLVYKLQEQNFHQAHTCN